MVTQLITLLGVLLGAVASYLAGFATERIRYRRDLDQQWTTRKLDIYASYINDIKQMRELGGRIAGGIGPDVRPQPLSRDEGLPLLAEAEARRSVSG